MAIMLLKEQLYSLGVIPVVALDDADDAADLANALIEGGLPCAEITFRTPAAEESIKRITGRFPDMLVGAGTVLSVEQVKKAVGAGARFIVTPGFDPEVVDYCIENSIPVFPGCVTPSEITQAYKRDLTVLKFFPAGVYGGLSAIKALTGPFPMMKFIPTGGINADNLSDYMQSDKVLACGGTWMVKKDLISNKEYDTIRKLAETAAAVVRKYRG